MKRVIVFTLLLMLSSASIFAQKGQAVVAAVGAIASIGGSIAAAEQVKEQFELFATEYIIENFNYNSFELKIDGLSDGAKTFDPSSVSVIAFNFTPIDYINENQIKNERKTILVFFDSGWQNEFGVDFTKVKFKSFSKVEWNELFGTYLSLASGAEITNGFVPKYSKSEKRASEGEDNINVNGEDFFFTGDYVLFNKIELTRLGAKDGNQIILPFKKINGDSYFIKDYSDEFKVVFNERSLGIYLKETKRLVQIKKSLIESITSFLNL